MKKLFELNELGTDAWTAAVSNMSDDPALLGAAIGMAPDDTVRKWLDADRCPGELEKEFAELAKAKGYSFDEFGNIA